MQSAILTLVLLGQVASPTPRDAAGWAIAHQVEQPAEQRPLWRYLWIPPYAVPETLDGRWDERHVAAGLSYAINEAASQSGIVVQPTVIANGWMLAVYLPNYASSTKPSPGNPSITELQSLVNTWDSLAVDDPYFHVTRENAQAEGVVERVAIVAPHVEQQRAEVLAQLNLSPALVYRADWFLRELLHLHYYEFMQFPKTQAEVYRTIGVDEDLAKEVNGDQRIGLFTSSVTGKPRRVDRIQGASGRFNTGAVFQSWDIFDESVSTNKHPIYSLLVFKPDGGEVIFERANGLHGYLLIDAKKNLVREAPPNLVADHTIPGPPDGPGTKQLVPGISCIRCHGPAEGLQTLGNDVATLLASGTDIIDDLSSKESQQDTVLRLAGLYSGDFGRRITLARDDYTLAVARATRMPGIPQGMDVQRTASLVSAVYGGYTYQRVDASMACRELGIDPGTNSVEALNKHLPRQTTDEAGNVFRENAVIAALRAGIPVRRADFELIYGSAMSNVQRN